MLHKKQIWFQKKVQKMLVFFSFFMLTAVRQMAFTTNSRYVSRFYACRQILNQFLKINCTQHSFLTIAYWHIYWRRSALNSAGALQGISGNFHPKNLPMKNLWYKLSGRGVKSGGACAPASSAPMGIYIHIYF